MSTKIFAILDADTNEFISFGDKRAWGKEGHAKQAFSYHMSTMRNLAVFNEQQVYKIVDLTEAFYRLEGLEK